MRGIALVTLTGQVTSNFPEVNSRTFNAMARAGIDVLLVTHDDERRSYSISLKESDAPKAAEILRTEFAPELSSGDMKGISAETGMAVLAVVREGVRKLSGLGTRLLNTLTREGVEVLGLSDGASEATVAVVVNDDGEFCRSGVREHFFVLLLPVHFGRQCTGFGPIELKTILIAICKGVATGCQEAGTPLVKGRAVCRGTENELPG